jgi:hypothetical protein
VHHGAGREVVVADVQVHAPLDHDFEDVRWVRRNGVVGDGCVVPAARGSVAQPGDEDPGAVGGDAEAGRVVNTVARAVEAGDPELAAVGGVVGDCCVVSGRRRAITDTGDEDLGAVGAHPEADRRVLAVAGTVVALDPQPGAVRGLVRDRRVVPGAPRSPGDEDPGAVRAHAEAVRRVEAVAGTVVAGRPDLGSVGGVVSDRRVVLGGRRAIARAGDEDPGAVRAHPEAVREVAAICSEEVVAGDPELCAGGGAVGDGRVVLRRRRPEA